MSTTRRTLVLIAISLFPALNIGCASFSKQADFFENFYDIVSGNPAGAKVRKMENPDSPDQRRIGINELTDRTYGRNPPYTTRYTQIATTDEDYLVRATAVRGLNISRDKEAGLTYIRALADENKAVRLEAAKALTNVPDEQAVPILIKMLANPAEGTDIRIACAQALVNFKRLDSARALVAALGDRDFGVAWQAHRSLTTLTGADFRYSDTAWLQYITGPDKPFG